MDPMHSVYLSGVTCVRVRIVEAGIWGFYFSFCFGGPMEDLLNFPDCSLLAKFRSAHTHHRLILYE